MLDSAVTSAGMILLRSENAAGTEPSVFAMEAEAPKRGGKASMDTYWCNRVHLEALRWASGKGSTPVAFLHVPALIGESLPLYGRHVAALYERFTGEVLAILDQMERSPADRVGSR